MTGDRKLEWDWYPGRVPDNVSLDETAYLETTYSFLLFRSEASRAVEIGAGTSIYLGTMFDVGRAGRVKIGKCALLNGARIQCDAAVTFGDYALISWNVVLMDSYRVPVNPELRRRALEAAVRVSPRRVAAGDEARPIHVGANVWIGFDCCVLPGVTIGDGSIVGARSVVADDVPPRTIVAGSPARVIRELTSGERQTNDETR
jgi:acetyltransferase-like isoleucine patch superfamily enzyme